MLPYTGTYAAAGQCDHQRVQASTSLNKGGKLGGREIEYVVLDDESEPAKATDNANRLVQRDKVDVLVGTVHSGVVMAMVKVARDTGTLLIIPNAGANAATGPLCAPNIFRTSFSNWQPAHPMGKVMLEKGHKTCAWTRSTPRARRCSAVSRKATRRSAARSSRSLWLPFPNVEFQALLTEIAPKKPDAVACFFAGGGAVKFVKDYAAAGPQGQDPALRHGLSHRRHAGGAGRRRRRHQDHAALRRRPR